MTLTQIRYILEVIKAGSISKASKSLFISQPSLSNTIRQLEEELGVRLFVLSNDGLLLTREGEQFYLHAKKIISECDAIQELSSLSDTGKITVSIPPLSIFNNAIATFCALYQDEESVNLVFREDTLEDTISRLNNDQTDIGLVLLHGMKEVQPQIEGLEPDVHIEFLGRISATLNISKQHPIIKEWNKEKPFDFKKLLNYPFIETQIPQVAGLETADVSHIQREMRKSVTTSNTQQRYMLLKHLNAYTFGCRLPEEIESLYDIVAIPLESHFLYIYLLYSNRRPLPDKSLTFIDLIKKTIPDD